MVLLPTPPLALATAMTLDTSLMHCFGGNPRVRLGIVPVKGSPAYTGLETLMSEGRRLQPPGAGCKELSPWQRTPVIIHLTALETRYCRKRRNQRSMSKARGQLGVELFRPRNMYLRETVDQFGAQNSDLHHAFPVSLQSRPNPDYYCFDRIY